MEGPVCSEQTLRSRKPRTAAVHHTRALYDVSCKYCCTLIAECSMGSMVFPANTAAPSMHNAVRVARCTQFIQNKLGTKSHIRVPTSFCVCMCVPGFTSVNCHSHPQVAWLALTITCMQCNITCNIACNITCMQCTARAATAHSLDAERKP